MKAVEGRIFLNKDGQTVVFFDNPEEQPKGLILITEGSVGARRKNRDVI
jgi:hypothetical protein